MIFSIVRLDLDSIDRVTEMYEQVLLPSFPPEEMYSISELTEMVEDGEPIWVALDESGRVVGCQVCEWHEHLRFMLLGALAVRPDVRGAGVGRRLIETAIHHCKTEFNPCIAVGEVEDPAHRLEVFADYGDPEKRLKFYLGLGARTLDLPYFQPSMGDGLPRVDNMMLMVFHSSPDFYGELPETISASVLRSYLESDHIAYEGKIGTDEQSMALWHQLDKYASGVPFRP